MNNREEKQKQKQQPLSDEQQHLSDEQQQKLADQQQQEFADNQQNLWLYEKRDSLNPLDLDKDQLLWLYNNRNQLLHANYEQCIWTYNNRHHLTLFSLLWSDDEQHTSYMRNQSLTFGFLRINGYKKRHLVAFYKSSNRVYDKIFRILNKDVVNLMKALGIDTGIGLRLELSWKTLFEFVIVLCGFTEFMIFGMFAIWGKALLAPSTVLIPMLFAVFFIATAIYMVFESFKALMKNDPDVENENENKGDDGSVSLFTKNLNSYLFQDEWKGKPLSQRRILDIAGLLGSSLVAVAAGIEMTYKFTHFMVIGKFLAMPAPSAFLVIGLAILAIKAVYCIFCESKYIDQINTAISKTESRLTILKLAVLKGKAQDVKKKNWISLFSALSIISLALMFFGVIPGVGAIVCVAFAIAAAVFTLSDRVIKLTQSGKSKVENQFYFIRGENEFYIKLDPVLFGDRGIERLNKQIGFLRPPLVLP